LACTISASVTPFTSSSASQARAPSFPLSSTRATRSEWTFCSCLSSRSVRCATIGVGKQAGEMIFTTHGSLVWPSVAW
jgi:hypothetical protein